MFWVAKSTFQTVTNQRSRAWPNNPARTHRLPLRVCQANATLQPSSDVSTYKRVVAKRCGTSFRDVACLQHVLIQAPGNKEVLVKLLYAGVNGGCETFRCRGEFSFSKNQPLTNFPLGAEGCGVVVAVGEGVKSLKVGQAVTCNSAGAFAEYAVVRDAMCTAVDEATPEAVALALSAVTACAALEVTAGIRPGETVLVTAAAGGTGHFAVQLAKLAGCHVIATCGSEEKAQALRGLGADCIINHRQQDVGQVLREQYPAGIDVVYEGVGGAVRQAALDNLAPTGRLLQVGYISDYPHTQADHDPSNASEVGRSSPGSSAAPLLHRPLTTCDALELDSFPPGPDRQCDGGEAAGRPGAVAPEAGPAAGPPSGDVPSAQHLFWGGVNVQRGQQCIIGAIWPKDLKAILRCRRRVFELHRQGQLQAWVDRSCRFQGVESVADAVDYMLRGGHIGKVVVHL